MRWPLGKAWQYYRDCCSHPRSWCQANRGLSSRGWKQDYFKDCPGVGAPRVVIPISRFFTLFMKSWGTSKMFYPAHISGKSYLTSEPTLLTSHMPFNKLLHHQANPILKLTRSRYYNTQPTACFWVQVFLGEGLLLGYVYFRTIKQTFVTSAIFKCTYPWHYVHSWCCVTITAVHFQNGFTTMASHLPSPSPW